ncbi:hypothetical protein SRABI128_05684 [Microbacterium sp. Bi128]|nr:hypothetical protein SRABI128_05684 [Microbacterium sp. Bi128]
MLRQERVQLRDAVDPAAVIRPFGARHPGHGGLERQEPVLDRFAHPAVANDQDAAVGQAGRGPGVPPSFLLVLDQAGQFALAGEDQGERQLRGGGLVHAGRVGEDPPGRQELRHAVVPDRLALHQGRVHRCQAPQDLRAAHVRRDHDVDPRQGRLTGEVPLQDGDVRVRLKVLTQGGVRQADSNFPGHECQRSGPASGIFVPLGPRPARSVDFAPGPA